MREIEEIIKWLNHALDAPLTTYVAAYKSAIKEAVKKLEYMDKHRWHDLREDPEDLPDDDCEDDFFMCCVDGGKYRNGYEVLCYFYDGIWESRGLMDDESKVIAWRLIDPLDEES